MHCKNCFYFASVGGDDECDKHHERQINANDNVCEDFDLFSETDEVIYHIDPSL